MNYKVSTRRTSRYGDNEWIFTNADGKHYRFPVVGHVWKFSPANNGWTATAAVVNAGSAGLFRIHLSKATPLALGDGEVYFTDQQTGGKLLLKNLPL